MIVTLDGAAGTGKSTLAKELAKALGFDCFDTGAMYRAFTLFLLKRGIDLDEDRAIKEALNHFSFEKKGDRFFVLNEDVTLEIRSLEVTDKVSIVAAKAFVRKRLVKIQRKFAKGRDAVFEGRDMGSVVFPKADFKFFLTADVEVRSLRRFEEMLKKFPNRSFSKENILHELEKRDHIDSSRKASPLKCPKGAIVVDTSHLSIDELVQKLLGRVRQPKRMKVLYKLIISLSSFLLKIFYRLKVHGAIAPGGAIIAATHTSFLDPPIVSVAFKEEEIHFLARSTLFKGMLGFFIAKLNAHPVKAFNKELFKEAAQVVRNGSKILIFPEGTRSSDGSIGKIKPGVELLSKLTSCPVIPVYIHGAKEAWGRERKWPKFSGRIDCYIGKPILPHDGLNHTLEEAWQKLRPR